uniref:Putative ovule protein n=1 Tax=Solanum chacoense TaxID=4108 RepID=A0A0V0IEC2_SOLCH
MRIRFLCFFIYSLFLVNFSSNKLIRMRVAFFTCVQLFKYVGVGGWNIFLLVVFCLQIFLFLSPAYVQNIAILAPSLQMLSNSRCYICCLIDVPPRFCPALYLY